MFVSGSEDNWVEVEGCLTIKIYSCCFRCSSVEVRTAGGRLEVEGCLTIMIYSCCFRCSSVEVRTAGGRWRSSYRRRRTPPTCITASRVQVLDMSVLKEIMINLMNSTDVEKSLKSKCNPYKKEKKKESFYMNFI